VSYTLVSLWTAVRQRLEAAGVDSPVLDARMLLEAGAGIARLDIITTPRMPLRDEQVEAVLALSARREAREPLSHIVGKKAFWTLELQVTPDVLTPRPDTELLVEAALEALPAHKVGRVLDIGTGSGAVLLAILSERALSQGVGVDISAPALAVARANGEQHKLNERASFEEMDWESYRGEGFDVVVSNPPYIPSAEIEGLTPEVSRHEPRIALDGGADGLDAYRSLFAQLPHWLADRGVFAFEVGMGQADAVKIMAETAGLDDVVSRADLAGIERVVSGRLMKKGLDK
jgi:release factor glutamine methyltransferase